MTFRHCVAVDLGASSGRVMLATWDCGKRTLTLREMHRFANCLQKQDGFDTWDIDALEAEIRTGLNNVCNDGIRIDSIGIDTWGWTTFCSTVTANASACPSRIATAAPTG